LEAGELIKGPAIGLNNSLDKLRIFIADDSAQLRSRLIAILRDLSEVEIVGEAEDCPEAIFAIRALKPDVVVLDIRMPHGNGLEVVSTLRQDKHFPIVMMLSNHSSTPYQTQAARAGAHYFFDKAKGIEQIKQTIRKMIRD
jgi:DNA-binding NarL/FixJ family response regulator